MDVDDADDIEKALALSLDPHEQENPQIRDPEYFNKMVEELFDDDEEDGARGASAIPEPMIYSTEELNLMNKKRPKSCMGSRIAAKFSKPKDFFNEDLYEAQLQEAIEKSKKDVRGMADPRRATSLSPRNTPNKEYSKVATGSRIGSGSRPTTGFVKPKVPEGASGFVTVTSARPSREPSRMGSNIAANPTNLKGKYRPVVIDGCNVAFQHGKNARFSADGLRIVYQYFKSKGYEDHQIVIIVKHIPHLLDEDKEIMDFLENIGNTNYN